MAWLRAGLWAELRGRRQRSRFAYATIHYEGTPDDDAYLLGIRVLLASIKASGTEHDFVVLVSPEVSSATRRTLLADGAVLMDVQNVENPFATYVKPHFLRTLNTPQFGWVTSLQATTKKVGARGAVGDAPTFFPDELINGV